MAEPRPVRPSGALQALAVVAAALACFATSPPKMSRNFPAWEVEGDPQRPFPGVLARVWVCKSGKQGLGLTLRLRGLAPGTTRVLLERATLVIGAVRVAAGELPGGRSLEKDQLEHLYLPFAFDNERLWNEGWRRGNLVLQLAVGGASQKPWRIKLVHRLRGFHRNSLAAWLR